ncbi:hypothetical protein [Aestuariibaculum sediminum]|uniref:Outer membrane protein beta-barrel domain-containing protein n=1 Tax=Aestuariibaculum sediminum TaxID=2770637 RepID=A0A8J6Q1Y8_9FLAO|nr:hypothetical protein [Aestuariibaculum sediminum]MBD0831409.1 hypothetical protein [Aestuariibaculum sediminum]
MKHIFKLLVLLIAYSITAPSFAQQPNNDTHYFQVSPRIGYDFPTYNNNTPYIDYRGGVDLGLSLDYYFNWFGLGFDFDYIKNKPKSTYPTTNLFEANGTPIINFDLTENKITRIFYGIGPNFQYRNPNRKFTAELITRLGLASIKGGRLLLTDNPYTTLLNFHAGYDAKSVFSFKSQLRFTYSLNDNFGINAGAYYLHHYNVEELVDSALNISSGYYAFNTFNEEETSFHYLEQGGTEIREEPCDCDIYSVGFFAGITYKFNKRTKVCQVCGEDHYPRCCNTCGCGVTVTARDKYTNETLPNTDVALTDLNGNIIQSGTTNTYGVVVFNDVTPNDYIVKGKLYNLNLEETSIAKAEFKDCKADGNSIQKVIKYGDFKLYFKRKCGRV